MYLDLRTPLLSTETCDQLIKWAQARSQFFEEYVGMENGLPDGNTYLTTGVKVIPGVRELISRFTIPAWPVFLAHEPNVIVDRHVDDGDRRNCVIIQPLFPKGNLYPGTFFWESVDAQEPMGYADFSDGLPKLINTQVIHNLVNDTGLQRLNFQICFSNTFEEVKKLWEDGQLLT